MSYVTCIITLVIVVFIPLKLTYDAFREKKPIKPWAIYWAFYSLLNGLATLIPFLGE